MLTRFNYVLRNMHTSKSTKYLCTNPNLMSHQSPMPSSLFMYAVYLFLFLLHFFGAPLTPNSEYTSHHAHKHIIGYLPKLLSYTNLLRFLNTG